MLSFRIGRNFQPVKLRSVRGNIVASLGDRITPVPYHYNAGDQNQTPLQAVADDWLL